MEINAISASDGFAIAMIAMIFLSMSVIGILLLCMVRSASRRDPHVDQLLDEIEEDARKSERAHFHGEPEKTAEPWEKDGDWWKS